MGLGVRRLYLSCDVRQLAMQKIWEKRALGRGTSEARARGQQDEATGDVRSSTYFNLASLRRHTARLVHVYRESGVFLTYMKSNGCHRSP